MVNRIEPATTASPPPVAAPVPSFAEVVNPATASLSPLPRTPPPETSARPQRAAKRRAIENIRNIQEWEQCNESSELFRSVARRFNEEMNNEILTREEREQVEQGDRFDNFAA